MMESIESIDDPRVAAYRSLKARRLRQEGIFITEGRALTSRMLDGPYAIESVFVAERFAEEFGRLLAGRAPVYVASNRVLQGVVGFAFHRGVLGCGRRSAPRTLDALLADREAAQELTLVICPDVVSNENLGSIFRIAAAFGLDGVVLGEPQRGSDPLSRRCLRLSMGAVFRIPFVESPDLPGDLLALKQRWGVELWGTVLDDRAEPLEQVCRPRRVGLLFGNEWDGLSREWLLLCDRRVTIPMARGTDSLNLAVAAGIFVHALQGGGPVSG